MTDYKKAADRVRELLSHIHPETDHDLDAAADLCELAAKADAEIDPDEEHHNCAQYAREFLLLDSAAIQIDMFVRAREDARLQAVLAAHKAYRELSDALAEFFYCGDPDDRKRLERAYDKTREL